MEIASHKKGIAMKIYDQKVDQKVLDDNFGTNLAHDKCCLCHTITNKLFKTHFLILFLTQFSIC